MIILDPNGRLADKQRPRRSLLGAIRDMLARLLGRR